MNGRQWVRRVLPARVVDALRVGLGRAEIAGPTEPPRESTYQQLYEAHARTLPPDASIGDGDYDYVGRLEMGVLVQEGLTPEDTLLDFGCGTGRLAVHAIPYLSQGRYIGTDIAPTMLATARQMLGELAARPSVEFVHQPDESFPVPANSVDVMCAFSVFTHMEHEDALRYLRAARVVVRSEGKLVLSCLPMTLRVAKEIFEMSAANDAETRWQQVRNVTTSKELMETVAGLAGWKPVRWYDGEELSVEVFGENRLAGFGQSALVLE